MFICLYAYACEVSILQQQLSCLKLYWPRARELWWDKLKACTYRYSYKLVCHRLHQHQILGWWLEFSSVSKKPQLAFARVRLRRTVAIRLTTKQCMVIVHIYLCTYRNMCVWRQGQLRRVAWSPTGCSVDGKQVAAALKINATEIFFHSLITNNNN